jgi:gluconolactonase
MIRRHAAILAIASGVSATWISAAVAQTIVGPPVLVSEVACAFTEGPVAAPDGRIFYSDVMYSALCADENGPGGGRIWTFDPESGVTTLFREPSFAANGLAIGPGGALYAAEGADHGGQRISRTDLATGDYRIVAAGYGGRRFNSPNDLTFDDDGRLYVTDARYGGEEPLEHPFSGVYRIDPDRTVTLLIDDLPQPNGIEVTPGGERLLVAVSNPGTFEAFMRWSGTVDAWGQGGIVAYELSADGSVGAPTILVDLGLGASVDGMALDVDGNVYAATVSREGASVKVFTPTGELIDEVGLPDNVHPTNIGFGRDADATSLYVTTASSAVYRLRGTVPGFHRSFADAPRLQE